MHSVAHLSFRRGHAAYHMVIADLASGAVRVRTVRSAPARPWTLVGKYGPAAAITGTFFAPGSGKPVADVLVAGRLTDRGNRGSAVAVARDGTVTISHPEFRRRFAWEGYRCGLRGAVRLIQAGQVCPNPRGQGFRDPAIWHPAARTGLGITRAGKLVLMATASPVSLHEFGRAMRAHGVVDAVSLDGGGSTMLYCAGHMAVPTHRRLSNLLILEARKRKA